MRFVDLLAGDVVTLLPTGSATRRHVDDVAAVIRHRADGGYAVAGEHRILLFDADWVHEGVIRVLDEAGRWLGVALASTFNVLDLEAVVLGGCFGPLTLPIDGRGL